MATENTPSTAKAKDAQAAFVTGTIVKNLLEAEFINEEALRSAFAMALGVEAEADKSMSSCHLVRALIDAGIIRTNPGK
jgi:hypothetical protein